MPRLGRAGMARISAYHWLGTVLFRKEMATVRWPPLESETGMVSSKSGFTPVPASGSYMAIELTVASYLVWAMPSVARPRSAKSRVKGVPATGGVPLVGVMVRAVAVAVADLMMTVPNRRLRLLDKDELQEYGLDGTNAAQDDLDRLQLMRRCGEDFVLRRDAFMRSFDSQCKTAGAGLDEMQACGLALREQFRFPDANCPADSPLSEFDRMADVEAAPEDAAGGPPSEAGTAP
mgnify:CR=1 FL=1